MEPALYLIPVTLGVTPLERVIPAYNHHIVMGIRHFVVEEIRTARRFLKMVDKSIDIDSLTFYSMGKHSTAHDYASYLQPLSLGFPVGVISEAGCPAVADPGADIVSIAQAKGYKVVPLVGPSSILMALMGSGFNGQSFAFNGYLPIEPSERTKKLKHLESLVYSEDQTQLFIETPFRNIKMFQELLGVLKPHTRLCVAAGITCDNEYIHTLTIREWKKIPVPDFNKIPAIFLIYK